MTEHPKDHFFIEPSAIQDLETVVGFDKTKLLFAILVDRDGNAVMATKRDPKRQEEIQVVHFKEEAPALAAFGDNKPWRYRMLAVWFAEHPQYSGALIHSTLPSPKNPKGGGIPDEWCPYTVVQYKR